jgi:phage tail sheath gpL-like
MDFNSIPDDLRVPLFYAEVDASRAGTFQIRQRMLILGHKLSGGTATDGALSIVATADQASALAGLGSMLHGMVVKALANDPTIEIHLLPVADPDGTAAIGKVNISGTATAAGVLPIYIGGRKLSVSVAVGDTATAVGAALAAAVTADTQRICSAANDTGTVTLTARHTGVVVNGTPVEVAPLGAVPGGEVVPAGLTVTTTDFADGVGVPDLATALAVLGDDAYDFIVSPFTDTAALDDLDDLLNGVSGRWSYAQQIYGHAFAAKVATLSALSTFGNARNGEHVTVAGLRACPFPVWEIAAAVAARAASSLRNNPARPLQTLEVIGITCRPDGGRFTMTERQTLLFDGIGTVAVDDRGVIRLERLVTTFQTNAFGQPDNAWLDVQTPFTLAEVLRRLRMTLEQNFARVSLVSDNTPIKPGNATVNPAMMRGAIISEYSRMIDVGLVENLPAFKANLIVERNADDPNRVDVLYPPDLVNQLRVIAVLAQYRLQYPAAA